MSGERLWAPWRLDYVTGADASVERVQPPEPASWLEGADHGCFLCRAGAEFADREQARRQQYVVACEGPSLVMLNRYPYNNGHLLVAPRRHAAQLADLTSDEHLACMDWLARLTEVFGAQSIPTGLTSA